MRNTVSGAVTLWEHGMAKSGKRKASSVLEDSPSHLLHRALQAALGVFAAETGAGALTQRQFALLAAAAELEAPSQTDLVLATGIDRSTLAELTARMIAKGLLERERSSTDGRAKTVRVTDQGREALEAMRPRVKAADKQILSMLPKPKREGFLKLLTRLGEASAAEPSVRPAKAKSGKKRRKTEAAEVAAAPATNVTEDA